MKVELRYLERLSELYPTIDSAATEIINLQSILNLPKGTEHFLSDLHGEYAAFSHVLRNGSGAVRKKIDDVFGHTLSRKDKRELASLIYYPSQKMDYMKSLDADTENWYRIMLYRLIEICKVVSSKYTRSKVRKALPDEYAYIIEELITEKPEVLNRGAYFDTIVDTILEVGSAEKFIFAMAELIQRLVVDHLHILGDIYDRGSGAHNIMDKLCNYHSLDIQWGNHDVMWMGSAAGNTACIANIIRNSLRYGNIDVLEDGYGINMIPLATFAMSTYDDDDCSCFTIKRVGKRAGDAADNDLEMKMHKAITIIQFKLEGQLISKYPDFNMDDRKLLHKIDFDNGTVEIDGKVYPMRDMNFPTIDRENPYELSEREKEVMEKLRTAFIRCQKLQRHTELLMKKGSLYKVYNGNLLFHGCVPLNKDGSFREVKIDGKMYSGVKLYNAFESNVRKALRSLDRRDRISGGDILWYLWNGPDSPLFGRDKMTTFERYFIEDKETHKEGKNAYYTFIENEEIANKILREFGLDETGHIINGHVPVHQSEGENPLKCGGKVIMIDGGYSEAYHKLTGIAGYTLTYNSYGLTLTAHEPFESAEQVFMNDKDIVSNQVAVRQTANRMLVGDTDSGKRLMESIAELKELIKAYRHGTISERVQ
ncbi:MAG: fructose-1,6-bisphosphatase [Oscillospiraceae bacterium]|nr:fructose-1,6-bisphosphatase [Oscillospiraceae bacterium]